MLSPEEKERLYREAKEYFGEDVKILVTGAQEPQQCDLCGKIDELRPYGPNGEAICFECGQKDPETTRRKFEEQFK